MELIGGTLSLDGKEPRLSACPVQLDVAARQRRSSRPLGAQLAAEMVATTSLHIELNAVAPPTSDLVDCAALLYGDGVITPAISVLSAVEGLSVATPALTPLVVPLALVILIGRACPAQSASTSNRWGEDSGG